MGLDAFSLKDKVAVVTGGSRGLGEHIAYALAEAGAHVAVASRDLARLEQVAENARRRGVGALAVKTDVTRCEEVQGLMGRVLAEFGAIDILVNNSGVGIIKPFVKVTEEEWDHVINTNLKGYFLCCQAAGREMIKRRCGKIVNLASVLGTVAMSYIAPYAASKGGIIQLTKALAIEWSRYNINVNAIAPSYVETGMTEPVKADKETAEFILTRTPLMRWGRVEEVTGAVVYLASEAASYVTGTVLFVDGGWTAW